jgi:hypothetical protein
MGNTSSAPVVQSQPILSRREAARLKPGCRPIRPRAPTDAFTRSPPSGQSQASGNSPEVRPEPTGIKLALACTYIVAEGACKTVIGGFCDAGRAVGSFACKIGDLSGAGVARLCSGQSAGILDRLEPVSYRRNRIAANVARVAAFTGIAATVMVFVNPAAGVIAGAGALAMYFLIPPRILAGRYANYGL